jgi:Tfp pilus assembly protein PilX
MAITKNRGFALLVAVIFMSVALALGLALASLAYKQEELASSSLQSQSALYAADAGLECALRADEQEDQFDYTNYKVGHKLSVPCGGTSYTATPECYNGGTLVNGVSCTANEWVISWQIPLAFANPLVQTAATAHSCAVVVIYKPASSGTTYLFSQGYDVSCTNVGKAGVPYVARGLSASYGQ